MLIGPFAGVWIDRYNRRTVMILADGLVAVSSIILGAAFLLVETPPIWFIYIVLFLNLLYYNTFSLLKYIKNISVFNKNLDNIHNKNIVI